MPKFSADFRTEALWKRTVEVETPGRGWEEWPESESMVTVSPYDMGADAGKLFSYPAYTFVRAEINEATRARTLYYKASATLWRITYTKILSSIPVPKSGTLIPLADIPNRP